MTRGLRLSRLAPLAVAAAACVPFLPSLDGAFLHWDDDVNFVANPHYRGLGWAHLRWMFTSTLLGHYIPLTWLSLALNHALGGLDPWGYHLGNVLLHAVNAALAYLVARRLLAAAPGLAPLPPRALAVGAAVAALLFAVHPLRVESVAWITERRDVLCGAFYLLAVLAYLRGVAGGGALAGRWRWAALSAFAAALLSKALAMTLPLTLLILDAYPLRRWRARPGIAEGRSWRALVAEKLPFAFLAAAAAVAAVLAVDSGAGWTAYDDYGPGARAAIVAYSLWFHPSRFVWAHGLSPLYELPARIDPVEARFLLPALAVAGVTAALVALRRRAPGVLAAWAHSAIVLLPISGLVHAGNQLAHDRYSYLSGLGFAVLAGAAVAWAWGGASRARPVWLPGAAIATAGMVLAMLGAASWRQSHVWHDSTSLWRAAADADPACAICANNLGAALMVAAPADLAALREAESHLRHALALRPGYADAYRSLAALLANERRYAEAEQVLVHLLRAAPRAPDAAARLAAVYEAQGRAEEALALRRRAAAGDGR